MKYPTNNARPLNFFETYASLLSKAQQIVALLPVTGCSTHITPYMPSVADELMTCGISVFLHYGNSNDHPTHPLILVEMTGCFFTTESELLADLAAKLEVSNPFCPSLATAELSDSEPCHACNGIGALYYRDGDGDGDCQRCGGIGVVPAQLASAAE